MSDIGNKDVFAKNLAYYIDKSGKTRGEICDELGIAYSTFSEWVKARKYPRIDKIELLANYFGILKSQLIEDRDVSPDLTTVTPVNFELANAPISMKRIAVIGDVAAGYQCLADMQVIDYVACDASLLHTGYEYVYLRVRGDSMEPELHEGDLVLVQVQDTIESGEYAVVLVDNEDGLVKRIEIDRTHITLISENPYYPPRRFDREEMNRIRIFGKVVSVMRRM